MKKYIKYFKYVVRHKYYVLIECYKLGVPMRGVLHDLHKLLPSEFIPYAKYFYGDWREDISTTLSSTYLKSKEESDFDVAWLHHQHRGKHHWQYWILKEDNGGTKVLPMPEKYMKEMLADWIGAGKAINGKNDVAEWYYANRDKMVLHPATKYWIESRIKTLES